MKIQNQEIISVAQSSASLPSYVIPTTLSNFDAIVLNSVSYETTNNNNYCMYFLYSTYSNSYIASCNLKFFLDSNNTEIPIGGSSFPNLEMQLKPYPMPLQFRLFAFNPATNVIEPVTGAGNDMVHIVLSLLKY